LGERAAAFQADLSSTDGAAQLFSAVKQTYGRVDILVNNAGTIVRGAAEDVSLEDWQTGAAGESDGGVSTVATGGEGHDERELSRAR
jgi:NAD(P)-dependent dehydrogenase (short-subunit alcohol dehydrogenase family)